VLLCGKETPTDKSANKTLQPTRGASGFSEVLGFRKNLASIICSAICPGRLSSSLYSYGELKKVKNKFTYSLTLSIGGTIGIFIAVLICSMIFDSLTYPEATLLAGSSIVPTFVGWFVGTIMYNLLPTNIYFKLGISGVVGYTVLNLLYYFTAEPVNGVTAFSINLSESILPHLFSGAIGIFIGLSLSHLLMKKLRPKKKSAVETKRRSCS